MLFDIFKKNKLDNNINEENLNDIGWQAIEQEVKRVYGTDLTDYTRNCVI